MLPIGANQTRVSVGVITRLIVENLLEINVDIIEHIRFSEVAPFIDHERVGELILADQVLRLEANFPLALPCSLSGPFSGLHPTFGLPFRRVQDLLCLHGATLLFWL